MDELDKLKKELIQAITLIYGPKEAEELANSFFIGAVDKVGQEKKPWKDVIKLLRKDIKYFKAAHNRSPELNKKKNQYLVKLILDLNPKNPKKAVEEMAEMLMHMEQMSRSKNTIFFREMLIDQLEKQTRKSKR